VEGAWVRATTGAKDPSMTGAFMTIRNTGSGDARLVRASSTVADEVQLHVMKTDGGTAHMHRVRTGFRVPAHGRAVLQPGGMHVMLMGLARPLVAGDEVTLVLTFGGGVTRTVVAPVKAFAEETGGYASPTPSPMPSMSMG
jgi:copper(I)-binding protein